MKIGLVCTTTLVHAFLCPLFVLILWASLPYFVDKLFASSPKSKRAILFFIFNSALVFLILFLGNSSNNVNVNDYDPRPADDPPLLADKYDIDDNNNYMECFGSSDDGYEEDVDDDGEETGDSDDDEEENDDEEEDDDDDSEEEGDGIMEAGELEKRAEEFIARVNRKWKEELIADREDGLLSP